MIKISYLLSFLLQVLNYQIRPKALCKMNKTRQIERTMVSVCAKCHLIDFRKKWNARLSEEPYTKELIELDRNNHSVILTLLDQVEPIRNSCLV